MVAAPLSFEQPERERDPLPAGPVASIMPSYRCDSPRSGCAGSREIYRFGDKGLVADFALPGNLSHLEVAPVNFVGADVTSFVFTGPSEQLAGPADLQRKLKEYA